MEESTNSLIATTTADASKASVHNERLKGALEVIVSLSQCHDFNNSEQKETNSLIIASWGGYLSAVRFLVEDGKYDPHKKSSDDWTPLYAASAKGHLHVVKYLIEEARVDPNKSGDNEKTPLHIASYNGHLEVVQYLVRSAGSDTTLLDHQGFTAIDSAEMKFHEKVVYFLKRHMEQVPEVFVQGLLKPFPASWGILKQSTTKSAIQRIAMHRLLDLNVLRVIRDYFRIVYVPRNIYAL